MQRAWAAPGSVALREVDLVVMVNHQKNLPRIAKDMAENRNKRCEVWGMAWKI